MMPASRLCADCGAEIPPDAPEGICRKCLIKVGLEDSAHIQIRCPHCHNPVEILSEAPLSDITCPSCDTNFSLIGDRTLTSQQKVPDKFSHFTFLETIGTGSFGTVYKSRDTELDRIVAVKVPRKGQLSGEEAEQFLREARAAAQLRHPNIVAVHEVGREDGSVYIVSDFVEGPSLADWLTARRPTEREAAELCAKVSDALQHAHEAGIIHRDLKPSNIMLDSAREPHIMDFGLAKRQAGEITMTMEGRVLGTPAYMSPEQAQGDAHAADERSDIYALGVVFFELLTGEKPFRGNMRMLLHQVIHEDAPSPRKLNGRLPADLETICLKCLEKEPRKRYATARQFGDELRRFLRSEPILARRITAAARLWRWCKRKPAIAALAAALVLVLLGGLVGVTGQWLRAESEALRARQNAADEALARQRAAAAQAVAEAEAERNRQLLYISDMSTALQAWEYANVDRVMDLLQRHIPDPRQTDLRGFEWYYLSGLCQRSLTTPRLEQDPVFAVTYSPDGELLATGGFRTLRLWNPATGEMLQSRAAHESYVGGLAFSPDGTLLATGSHDRTIKLWDVVTGESVALLRQGFSRAVTRLAFSPDGTTLAANGLGGRVTLWSVPDGERQFLRHRGFVQSLSYSHDGTLFASGSGMGTIQLWDLRDVEQAPQTIEAHSGMVWSLAFSPDDTVLVSGSRDDTVKLWHTATGEEKATLDGHGAFVSSVAFSPDGAELASASWDGTVKLWDAETGRLKETLKGHSHYVDSIDYSPDGTTLASGSADRKVMLWNLSAVSKAETARGHGVVLEASGETLAIWTRDGSLTLWDETAGMAMETKVPGEIVGCAAISPDGETLAAGSVGATVKLWDLETGQELHSFPDHPRQKWMTFSPDGTTLVTAVGTTLKLWDTSTFELRASVEVYRPLLPNYQYPVAFSPDSTTLATAIQSETESRWTLHLWRVSDGSQQLTLPGHDSPVGSVAFAPDGKTLASVSHGGDVQLWDLETGEAQGAPIRGHVGGVYAVTFSPDGKRLVSGASDGSVKFWDLSSRDEVITLKGGTGRVFTLAFSSNGQILATANEDETVKLWRAHFP